MISMKDSNNIKIFLVDDDVVFSKLLELEFHQNTNYSIETYATGKLCIGNLFHNPDAIILDYQLDGIDKKAINGIETLNQIMLFNPDIPVIILSSQDKIDVAVRCIHQGAFEYVVKGETIFLRLQNIITSINRIKKIEEKAKSTERLIIANKELAFQYEEKEKLASELIIANKELHFQNEEKQKRADEFIIANIELHFQNEEKEKRAAELIIANKELLFQNDEKEKRAAELFIANKELYFQNEEKQKRADEFIIANMELHFQNEEKEKRAAELIIANKELLFQNDEKEKRAAELSIANKELHFQNEEKQKRADELIIANIELLFQNDEKEKRAAELIIAKEKAEESDNLKTAFLQNISHEIRTPLNGIIGFSTLLNEEDLSRNDIKEYTTIINRSGQRLLEIVNNVLDISKIQTGQLEGNQYPLLINTLLSDLLAFYTPITIAKKITLIHHNLDDKNRIIYSDEGKLNQILANLINNSIKFTSTGKIEFGYTVKNNTIQFYVQDTGIGIPVEIQDRIFERFFQADHSSARLYGGTGLGLAICKGLVELMGGKIWVESEINQGSTFYFTLPYVPIVQYSKNLAEYSTIPEKMIKV